MIYFTADTHFGHQNIINLSKRPFQSLAQMHQTLISNWNARVQPQDEIYILGDFSYRGQVGEVNQILARLNGTKYLIVGNHDGFIDQADFDPSAFAWIKPYYVLCHEKRKFVLFHYPILEWQGFFGNAIHLYGHVHNSAKEPAQRARLDVLGPRALNVGVDVNDFFPLSINEVIRRCGG